MMVHEQPAVPLGGSTPPGEATAKQRRKKTAKKKSSPSAIPPPRLLPDGTAPDFGNGRRSPTQKKEQIQQTTDNLKNLILGEGKLPAAKLPDGSTPDFGTGASSSGAAKPKNKKKSSQSQQQPKPRTSSGGTYAGASFHEAPSAFSLPKPSFSKRSVN